MSGALYHKPAKALSAKAAPAPPSLALNLKAPVTAALAPLSSEDMARVQGRQGLDAVGVHRRLPQAVAALTVEGEANRTSVPGAWVDSSAGPIWRLHVIAREAFAMRVHFHDFAVGDGRVWVHTNDGQTAGPYSGTGLFDNGDFWSDIVFGESLTIEYQPAGGSGAPVAVPFEVREVSHIWRDPRDMVAGSPAPPWPAAQSSPAALESAKAIEPQRANAGGDPVEQAAPCQIDVNCAPEWAQTAQGVGMILFETGEGTAVCSGSMLNTRANTFDPYFLTAAHCLKTEAVARTILSFWRFQSQTCNGPAPDLNSVPRTSQGAHVLSTLGDFGDAKGDMTFLQVLGELPDGIFFEGWDPTHQAFGTRVTGIHHPRGTYKRISSGTIVPDTYFDTNPQNYALVAETQGRTESGSSGSALFSQPGVVVGALSFGLKTDNVCALNPSPAGYTQFSVIYPQIRSYLESSQGPPTVETPTTLQSGQAERYQFGPVTSAVLFTGEDEFVLNIPDGAARVTLTMTADNANVDADLFVRFDQPVAVDSGNVIADFSSESTSGNEQIVIDSTTSPALRSGSLYVAIGLFDTNVVSSGSLTATIEMAPPPEAPVDVTLTPGQPFTYDLPAVSNPTLFEGSSAFRIDVPQGATQLDVQINTTTPGADVDLHVRRGTPPVVQNGEIVSDLESTSLSGNELVTLTTDTGLTPGTYYAALSVWTENTRVQGQIRADILTTNGAGSGAQVLSSGEQGRFDFPSVDAPSFFSDTIFAVDVPAGASRLVVDLVTETANADLDLFVRLGQPPAVEDSQVVANYSAEGLTGNEQIVIDASSSPPLQPGRYYFGMVVYTTGVATTGRVTATVGGSTVQLGAVTNAASFEAGVVSPGQIVSLFGSGMGPAQGVQPGLDASGRVPTYAGGVVVLFGGVPGPLFFVRGDQINAQVPYDVAGRGAIDVVVIYNGVTTNVTQVQVRDAAPGFFEIADGSNRAIAVNSNGTLNSASNPAARGDYVIFYATGGGLATSGNDEGLPAPSNPLATLNLPTTVRFGGVAATPFFSGLAPGFAGLVQVNVFIPTNAPTGSAVPLELLVGGFSGSKRPTIAIQ
ncbi:MAG: trypsin-like peptidase domain-containing protein [Bryobacterales bacterium]|nr:trypsin-like peptidase domain-containing protein [Bryobacterales bacterium]